MHVNITIKVYYRAIRNNSDKRDPEENSPLTFVGFKIAALKYILNIHLLLITHGSAIHNPNRVPSRF